MTPRISIVAPVFNEEATIGEFHRRLGDTLAKTELEAEIIYVNDGSSDSSENKLIEIQASDPRVRILNFSRNFGHQIAVKAGIDHARGEALVIIDSDLQDPPETIIEMIAVWRSGYEVVYAVRAKREGETFVKKLTAALYYRFMKRVSPVETPLDAGDFRLISRSVADVIKNIREKNLYLRGLIAWAGFRQKAVQINRQARYAGKSTYTFSKMLRLAVTGLMQFSDWPLRMGGWFGAAAVLFAFAGSVCLFLRRFVLGYGVDAVIWAALAVFFMGGVQLLFLSILSGYIFRQKEDSSSRPLYILR
jgi:dolichol-phosphate mannosyltransferase